MKKNHILAIACAAVLLCAAAAVGFAARPAPALAAPLATDTTASVTVSGSGVTTVKPDKAVLSVGAAATNKSAKEAQAAVNKIAEAMIKAAKDAGLKDADIRTSGISLYPTYDYSGSSSKINGYQANYTLTLIVYDIAKVGDVLDAQVNAGANANGSVSFGLKDDAAAYDEALKAAVQNAKRKAGVLATAAGKTLGDPVVVEESANYSYQPVPMRAEAAMMDKAAGTPVMAEGIDVSASVSITFALK